MFRVDNNKVFEDDSDKANETIKNLSKSKKLKNNKSENLTYILNIGATRELIFLTSNTEKDFNHLK